jgi:hypothetical protein
MHSDRASGSDAFALVQHKSRISEASYFDSSSACSNSGFGTGGHRSATGFTSRRRVGSHNTTPVEVSRALPKHSTHNTPMTEKARSAASPPAVSSSLRKMAHRKCEICRRPGPRFQPLPGRKRNTGDPQLPSYRFPKRLKCRS